MLKPLTDKEEIKKRTALFFDKKMQTMYKVAVKTGVGSGTLSNYKNNGDGKWEKIAQIVKHYPHFIYCFLDEIPDEQPPEITELQQEIRLLKEKLEFLKQINDAQNTAIKTYISK